MHENENVHGRSMSSFIDARSVVSVWGYYGGGIAGAGIAEKKISLSRAAIFEQLELSNLLQSAESWQRTGNLQSI